MQSDEVKSCPWCKQIPQGIGHGFYMHQKHAGPDAKPCPIGSVAFTLAEWHDRTPDPLAKELAEALSRNKRIIDAWMISYFDTEHSESSVREAREYLKKLNIETTACLWSNLDIDTQPLLLRAKKEGVIQ